MPRRARRLHRNSSVKLHAQPYDVSARGWYFTSAEDWNKKFKSHLPVEEYEIEFIDGSDAAMELFRAMEVNQANVEEYFEKLPDVEALHREERAALHYALDHLRIGFDKAMRLVEDDIRVMEGTAKDYVEEMFESGGLVSSLSRETIERYFDYESFGRDLGFNLDTSDPDNDRWLDMGDEERGEEWIDEVGIDYIFEKPRDRREQPLGERYFDYDSYARDLELNGELVEFEYDGSTWTTDYTG